MQGCAGATTSTFSFSLGARRRGHPARPASARCLRQQRGRRRRQVLTQARHETADGRSNRNPNGFHASLWGDFFLHHHPASSEQQTWMVERVEELKKKVAKLIAISATSSCSLLERLSLIHALERLCVDYLFETEISAALSEISNANVNDYDLHTVALWFYLLRKHGYKVSPDVFEKFLDNDGAFIAKTPRELLSFYNAAHFGTPGEILLDEAIHFTKSRLKSKLPYLVGSLAREVQCALEIPLARRVAIYEAKIYISAYEEETMMNKMILELAKLNFNLMQLQYQQELKITTSWDPKVAHDLPECMQYVVGKIMETYQTIENELLQKEKYRMTYLRNFTVDVVKNYNKEVKMCEESYVPESVKEHLQISARTGACHLLACTSLVGLNDVATKDSFDWVSTMPKIVQQLCIILRLLDDIMTYEREQMTPHVASTIDSYMIQHNVSLQTAREKIRELKEESWKVFNAQWLEPDNDQPRKLLKVIFNLTRTMEFMYNKDDNFTNCHNLKDTIRSLFVESIDIV